MTEVSLWGLGSAGGGGAGRQGEMKSEVLQHSWSGGGVAGKKEGASSQWAQNGAVCPGAPWTLREWG